jgi:hypothetical protein
MNVNQISNTSNNLVTMEVLNKKEHDNRRDTESKARAKG